MSYDIIIRFKSKEIADDFCAQMSDGYGENFCDFSFFRKKEGASGDSGDDYEEIFDSGKRVYFVNDIFI